MPMPFIRRNRRDRTQERMAPASPGVNPEALQAMAPPTMASKRLVGSTGKKSFPSLCSSTDFLMSSKIMPTGLTTVFVMVSTRIPGFFISERETIIPSGGVALPVRFERPADRVTGIRHDWHMRRIIAHSRSFDGLAMAEAFPGRFELSVL